MVNSLKLHGLPGTGKTTKLAMVIADLVNNQGYEMSEICYNTYLKKMAKDAKNKIFSLLDIDEKNFKEELRKVSTTHGICYYLLDYPDVVEPKHKKEFCEINNFEYGEGIDSDGIPNFNDSSLAGRLFAIKSYIINNMIKPEEWYNEKQDDITPGLIKTFIRLWNDYKNRRGLIDYDDMLEMVYQEKLCPKVRAIFWDEYQDVTPLQHEIAKIWYKTETLEHFVIAGDPYQTVYGFTGASEEFFNDWDFKTILLEESFRMNQANWSLIRKNYPKNIPDIKVQEGGIVKIHDSFDLNLISDRIRITPDKSFLILFRANYMADDIAKHLILSGIPFEGSRYGWTEKDINIYNFFRKYLSDEKITTEEIKDLVKVLKSKFLVDKSSILNKNIVTLEYFLSNLKVNVKTIIQNIFDDKYILKNRLSVTQRKKLYNALNFWKINIPKVELSTIHKKKGGEADITFVFNSITRAIEENLENQHKDSQEHNIFLVAFSRNKEELHIINEYYIAPVYEVRL